MPMAVVLREARHWTHPFTTAFVECFKRRGWKTRVVVGDTSDPAAGADIVAGYGWGASMKAAHRAMPDRVVHLDLAFWGREASFMKLALGGRWSPLDGREYDGSRLAAHRVRAKPSRAPGRRVLVCGMSAKAAKDWGLAPQEWERAAIGALLAAGASVVYRPKPTWRDARRIEGAEFDNVTRRIEETLARVDAVATHHSNAAVDAIAAGLPVYSEIGMAQGMSVPRLEDVVGASAHDRDRRERFLREVAWHQWTVKEIAAGAWLESPAPLAGKSVFGERVN